MVDYIKTNDISRVVCLEISRLGRNTLEALKVINNLNENGVILYVKNYNLETKRKIQKLVYPSGVMWTKSRMICL